ncbi:MAG: hypothetical protein IAE80_07220 [Anaerolinea sp.]|nr:hypothetical protein [Anaerolinea sp.]
MVQPLAFERFGYTEDGSLLTSAGVTAAEAEMWRSSTSLQPAEGGARAYGLFAIPRDQFLVACAYGADGGTVYEYVIVPRETLAVLAGNLAPLVALFDLPMPRDRSPLPPLRMSALGAWSARERRTYFERLYHDAAQNDFRRVMGWLGAALHERGLMIADYPGDTNARLAFVKGMLALLPSRSRPDLTFSTQRHEKTPTPARVVFSTRGITTMRWISDWADRTIPGDDAFAHPYIRHLLSLWTGDIGALLNAIDHMDSFQLALTDRSLQAMLAAAAQRHDLDTRIQAGERLPVEALKTVLHDVPPDGDIRRAYADQLLRYALEQRDTDAALIVTRLMDVDPALDESLSVRLNRDLTSQPDAVYAFTRARAAVDADERWRFRLRAAALASLRVAILDGDAETVLNWLRLIAREPVNYGLGEILHNGILAAQERARRDSELAKGLLLLAIRRDAAALETLLSDESLLRALPNALGRALREADGDPMAILTQYGAEVFVVVLARGAFSKAGELFTPSAVEQLWKYYAGNVQCNVPTPYSPDKVIAALTDQQPVWLNQAAVDTLLMLALRDQRDDVFFKLIRQPIKISMDTLWRLLSAASEMRDEPIIRATLRRLTAELESIEDEDDLVTTLDELFELLHWSIPARQQVVAWWRDFAREQPPARLGRLDRALVEMQGEGSKRPLDDLRSILGAVSAFRRMLGKRTLSEFAEHVRTAFDLLQSLSESFDPSPRRPAAFDPATVRAELDDRAAELPLDERQLLASHFKELAAVISEMAEYRSKANLIRRGEDVDRQLMTGEQQPHSAVDVLKWMSGYLSGTQDRDEDEDA